ncbi:hypothetical protein SAMN05216464_101462 [Mucilaginibacter pineti]|uniref:Uncharacterized protein n=1 Tax=Mucilaginibacter pineti TaxID=1391627 RepID=A0A1G6TY39_9SPHI|nr:hypothetical protein SAMN05216464_101462 [Mucilaginibacter pineti]
MLHYVQHDKSFFKPIATNKKRREPFGHAPFVFIILFRAWELSFLKMINDQISKLYTYSFLGLVGGSTNVRR